MTKKIFIYSVMTLLIISFFGVNFILSIISNILILLFLIPLLLIIILFLSFNTLKSKIKICNNCGSTIIGNNDKCIYCGTNLSETKFDDRKEAIDPSKETIEIDAEEIK